MSLSLWKWLLRKSGPRRKHGRKDHSSWQFRPHLEALEGRCLLSTFTVKNLLDSGPSSLRQAILNANSHPGLDTIKFRIGLGPQTIHLLSALPTITDPVIIDGTTQPGSQGRPIIELDGSAAGAGADGLKVTAGGSTIRGLVIDRFNGNGITLTGTGGNVIADDLIGVDLTGSRALGNQGAGVFIASSGNTIGGSKVNSRDVLSANGGAGIVLEGPQANGNQVLGDLIGTDISGQLPLGNRADGVLLEAEAANNTIGGKLGPGFTLMAGNVMAGNQGNGAHLADALTTGNKIQGNFIGSDLTGQRSLGNFLAGVLIDNASNNAIGGTLDQQSNLISGNTGDGVTIRGPGATANQVRGNLIGTALTGLQALGNLQDGVLIDGAAKNTIGGMLGKQTNVLSGNAGAGVAIHGTTATANQVRGNLIGADRTGEARLGNVQDGVRFDGGAANNTIGGALGANVTLKGGEPDRRQYGQWRSPGGCTHHRQ
jgi:hypothetical protein